MGLRQDPRVVQALNGNFPALLVGMTESELATFRQEAQRLQIGQGDIEAAGAALSVCNDAVGAASRMIAKRAGLQKNLLTGEYE
jgi:hypothetical protein